MTADLEVRTTGALAVTTDQTEWTEQQLAVLRSAGVSEEVTPAELAAFLHECQRTRLDPFTRQIYLIGRYDNQLKRKVFRSQTGIDGYRVIAHRVVREEQAELEYEETLWCGHDGVWRDVWLSEQPPAAAKVVVLKNGKRFPSVATLAEYAARYPDGNPYPMWRRMPANQLAKCAEALALRKAFPQDLAGIYTAEEMEQAEARDSQQPVVSVEQVDDAETVTEPEQPRAISDGQRKAVFALLKAKHGDMPDEQRYEGLSRFAGRKVASLNDYTYDEASNLIDVLSQQPDFQPEQPQQAEPERMPQAADDDRNFAEAEALLRLEHGQEAETLEADLRDAIESSENYGELTSAMNMATAARDDGRLTREQYNKLAAAADQRAASSKRTAVHA